MSTENVHLHEINKFGSQAERWWDKNGEFKTLHDVNPLRISFIQKFINPQGKRMVDVGCGGGILTEGLANKGANITGIDLSQELLDVADLHSLESGSTAKYQKISAEALADAEEASFDHVVCMEMLEHVPDPSSVIVACAKMLKLGGYVFFSTLNRKPKAYLMAIIAAEYVLKMLPIGTHDYKSFIKPSELSQSARNAGLELVDMIGIQYNPLTKNFSLSKNIDINYIAVYKRPE
jgi:2-polyprenyl-6-hydroxyphenyl methylase/3-demethylubiquinone-9 3-methyltransferase